MGHEASSPLGRPPLLLQFGGEMKKMTAMHRICIASFSDERLNFTRQNFPEVCLSMGPKEIWDLKKKTAYYPYGNRC